VQWYVNYVNIKQFAIFHISVFHITLLPPFGEEEADRIVINFQTVHNGLNGTYSFPKVVLLCSWRANELANSLSLQIHNNY